MKNDDDFIMPKGGCVILILAFIGLLTLIAVGSFGILYVINQIAT